MSCWWKMTFSCHPLEDCLREAGHEVEVVKGGNDALNALHRDPHGYDALVTDVRLGSGQD